MSYTGFANSTSLYAPTPYRRHGGILRNTNLNPSASQYGVLGNITYTQPYGKTGAAQIYAHDYSRQDFFGQGKYAPTQHYGVYRERQQAQQVHDRIQAGYGMHNASDRTRRHMDPYYERYGMSDKEARILRREAKLAEKEAKAYRALLKGEDIERTPGCCVIM
ncbi:hypothetical protein ABW19_dt0207142 [Dactylella cylindrospora]|nr:hypothetical protein ABW19_dt0207142 [Dactylella cylindrospora]